MVPSCRRRDNFVRVRPPNEALWLLVMVGDEPVYGRLKIDDAVEDTPFETAFCQDGEKALDGVDPACRGRRELAEVGVKWKVQRGCRASHSMTFGCLWVA